MYYRGPRRYRSPYRRGNGSGALVGVTLGAVLASGIGAKAAVSAHGGKAHARTAPAHATVAAAVAGTGENAFFTAVMADLGAPATPANLNSLAAWAGHEGAWGTVGQWNPLDSTLPEPGSTDFNVIPGCACSVQNYPDVSEGAQATAVTIGAYPGITAALRAGQGVCGGGLSGEFSRWSGGGYTEVC